MKPASIRGGEVLLKNAGPLYLDRCHDGELNHGPDLPAPHSLMIAQLWPDPGYYLLYLDESGEELTDTYHDTLEEALDQAKWEFNVEPDEWDKP